MIAKIKYHLTTRVYSKLIKHNVFDSGFRDEKPMFQALEYIHKSNKIDYLIVTGAPFSLLYFGTKFKIKFPEIKLISDFRDPWTWGTYYGLETLSSKQKKFQRFMEATTLSNSDIICYPTKEVGDIIKEAHPKFAKKLTLVPHAYDRHKIEGIPEPESRSGFIYGGSIYQGIEPYLEKTANVIKSLNDFKWNIYSNYLPKVVQDIFDSNSVVFHGFVDERTLFKKIKASIGYLAYFPPTDKDMVSTKFFEIIYLQTPIIIVVEEGAISKFIKENEVGVHILPENIETELPTYLNGNIPFNKDKFDVTEYDFETVTQNFVEVCEKL